jgi:hypothetical protein
MAKIDLPKGTLELKQGQQVEFHYLKDHTPSGFRNALDAAVRSVGAYQRPDGTNQEIAIKDCVVEMEGETLHIWAPGTEGNPR